MKKSHLRHSIDVLERSEARLALALDIETVGVIFFDSSGRITDSNSAFLRMTGFTRADFESGTLRWDKVTPREWVETSAASAPASSDRERSQPYEREYFRKDGSRWWGLVAAQWLSEDEGVEFVLDVTARKMAETELARAQQLIEVERTRRNLRRHLIVAEEHQRKRLARNVHDQLGQHLTAISLELEQARDHVADNPSLADRLARLAALCATMTRDARSLALELRPPELDDVGLASAIESYLTQWTARYDIAVDIEFGDVERLDDSSEQATTAYRILQEAMTNIARHAGASCVSVIVDRPDTTLRLIVEDDGRGFNPEQVMRQPPSERRYGLAGMRERAELAGGELIVESAPGAGTTIFAKLPVGESSDS